MLSVFRELQNAVGLPHLPEDRRKLLGEIKDYILSGTWTKNKKYAQRVIKILHLGYKDAAISFGISENGIRLLVARASKSIRDILGSTLIKQIVDGSEGEFLSAISQFYVAVQGFIPEKFFQADVYYALKQIDPPKREYSLSEMTDEIDYLRLHTRYSLSMELELLNDDKLSYIYQVLSSKSPLFHSIRARLYAELLSFKEEP